MIAAVPGSARAEAPTDPAVPTAFAAQAATIFAFLADGPADAPVTTAEVGTALTRATISHTFCSLISPQQR